jgi:hypothetical protein
MTPKEKAKELVERFTFICKECNYDWNAKQCALIAVDEIINDDWYINTFEDLISRKTYWKEVKQEIEKL